MPSADLQARLEAYVLEAYAEGRSLREIGELVDRSQTAVRRVLDRHQVRRRPAGAPGLAEITEPTSTTLVNGSR